jgi:hypothetical protein
MEIDPPAGLGVGDRRGFVQEQSQGRTLAELELDGPTADDPSGRPEEFGREARHVSWGRAGHGESQERDREHRAVQVAQQFARRVDATPELFLKRSTKIRVKCAAPAFTSEPSRLHRRGEDERHPL